MNILITGGAGFIGSYLVDLLYRNGHNIFIVDNLINQVHGVDKYNSLLYKSVLCKATLIEENILNSPNLKHLVGEVDCIVHLAAETGTGQSMYNISRCIETNLVGTTNILEHLVKNKNHVKKFVLASSRAVYGEGKYECLEHGVIFPTTRKVKDLQSGEFELKCPFCNQYLIPLTTDEESIIVPNSVYAISKYNQEQLVKLVCESIDVPYSIFRFQNVYGKGQSIKNPYVGILTIFSTLCKAQKRIEIFEDGQGSRDFIHVSDAVSAIFLDLISDLRDQTYNVGSGIRVKIIDIIDIIGKEFQSTPKYYISGSFRLGDIRHNFADITKISRDLGFRPKVTLSDGLAELISWIKKVNDDTIADEYEKSINEMKEVGLFIEKRNEI